MNVKIAEKRKKRNVENFFWQNENAGGAEMATEKGRWQGMAKK